MMKVTILTVFPLVLMGYRQEHACLLRKIAALAWFQTRSGADWVFREDFACTAARGKCLYAFECARGAAIRMMARVGERVGRRATHAGLTAYQRIDHAVAFQAIGDKRRPGSPSKLYFSEGKYYLAAWEFEYAGKLMPHRIECQNNIGLVYEKVGKLDEATNAYTLAYGMNDKNPVVIGNLARARIRRGDDEPAVRKLLDDLRLYDDRHNWVAWANERLALVGNRLALGKIGGCRSRSICVPSNRMSDTRHPRSPGKAARNRRIDSNGVGEEERELAGAPHCAAAPAGDRARDSTTARFRRTRTTTANWRRPRINAPSRSSTRAFFGAKIKFVKVTCAFQVSDAPMGDLAGAVNCIDFVCQPTPPDSYGRQATFSYLPDQQSGRWVISQIAFPNGHKAVYGYENSQLASVTFDDGTQSTFSYGTDAVSQCSTVQMFDVAALGSHRSNKVHLTNHCVVYHTDQDTPLVFNQSSMIIRMLLNGSNEVAFLSMSAPGIDPNNASSWDSHRLVYEGAGKLKVNNLTFYSQHYQSWTLGDPAQGYNAVSGTLESVHASWGGVVNDAGTPDWLGDSQGHQFGYVYDGDTFVTQRNYTDGSYETFSYNGFKQITRYQDRNLNVTLNTYDAQGNLLSREVGIKNVGGVDTHQPEYAKYQWTYYPAGDANQFLLQSAIDANGNSTQYFYDATHRLTSVVEAPDAPGDAQATTTISYDAASRVQQILDPMNRAVVYDYDERDRVSKITYGDSSTERFIYGSPGSGNENLLVRQKDRNGATTRFDYDAAGRVSTTTYAYSMMDQADNETLITDPSVTATKSCTYLNGTELVASCTERGETTSYGYDYRHRVVSTSVQPRVGVTLTSTRTYVNNMLFSESDPYGRIKYFAYRSSDGELIREIQGTVPSFTLADFNAVINQTRDATPNARFLITDYQLDNNAKRVAIIDGNNVTLAHAFDSRGQLVQAVEASGTPIAATTSFLYDADGNLIEERTPRYFDSSDPQVGNCRVQMTYTGRNLLATRTEAPGTSVAATVQYVYNLDRTQAKLIDARSNSWQTLWSACCAGRKTAEMDPLAGTQAIEYDNAGNVTFVQIVQGTTTYNQTTTRYDARHRPIFRTVWLTTAPNVDPNNPPIAGQNGVPGASGLTTQWYYDENLSDDVGLSSTAGQNIAGVGNVSIQPLLAEVQSDGIPFGAGSDGYAILEVEPDGELAVIVQDGAGRSIASGIIQPPTAQNPNQPITWSTRLDDTVATVSAPGNLLETAQFDALDNVNRRRIDGAGRTIQLVDAESNVTAMTFDANSNQLTVADPNSVGYTAVFDARNRETSRTDTMNAQTQTGFDANSNVVKTIDAKNASSTATFDARDRRVSLTDRVGGTTTWVLDANSNIVSLTDSEANTTQFEYDPRNLSTTETYADHSPPAVNDQVTLVYDGARRLQTRTDQQGDYVTMIYDMANRLTARQYRDHTKQPTDPPNDIDSFTFDGDSHLLTAVSGRYSNTVTFTYDAAGRLASEALTIGGQNYTAGGTYDPANRLVTQTYPDGSIVAQTFTARNLLQQVDHQGSLAASYTYDAGGRRSTRTLGDTPGTTTTWGYVPGGDAIASVTTPNLPSFTYTYDANENKTSESVSGVLQSYGFSTGASGYDSEDRLVAWNRTDNAQNQSWTLTKAGDWQQFVDSGVTHARTHNAVHELTADNGALLSFDAKGSLIANAMSGGSFTWDFDNQLQQASVSGTTATFACDALGRRVSKTAGGVSTVYVPSMADGSGPARVVAEYLLGAAPASPTRSYAYGACHGEPATMFASGATYNYHFDARGSARMITGAEGAPREFYSYTAYGAATILAADGTTVLAASGVGNSTMFAGHRFDAETGLYSSSARYFDPKLGRYIGRDPQGYADGPNLYEYSEEMPCMLSGGSLWGSSGLAGAPVSRGLYRANGPSIANDTGIGVGATADGAIAMFNPIPPLLRFLRFRPHKTPFKMAKGVQVSLGHNEISDVEPTGHPTFIRCSFYRVCKTTSTTKCCNWWTSETKERIDIEDTVWVDIYADLGLAGVSCDYAARLMASGGDNKWQFTQEPPGAKSEKDFDSQYWFNGNLCKTHDHKTCHVSADWKDLGPSPYTRPKGRPKPNIGKPPKPRKHRPPMPKDTPRVFS